MNVRFVIVIIFIEINVVRKLFTNNPTYLFYTLNSVPRNNQADINWSKSHLHYTELRIIGCCRYQQSDLDLVRCRHGNFDSVRRNRNAETMSGDSGRRYARGTSLEDRCHRNSELDLVGTLPKRKQDTRNGGGKGGTNVETNSSSSQPCVPDAADNDLLMQIVHKPDCELVRHRQQLGKCIDLKLSKLAGGEPQDQGYASERSPEDEHPPSLPGQPFPNITPGEFKFYIFHPSVLVSSFKFG